MPLVYIVDLSFSLLIRLLNNPGMAIIGVSIVVSVLCMPLYRMADRLQRRERARQKDMEHWVAQIRANFHGDERYMMLSTYYREQGYKPIYALASSLPLLLQVPIFIAAYTYLSNLNVLQGASFLFLRDLSAPDALIPLGNLGALNLMPILMTLLNCVSTAVYTQDAPLREKVQAYALAALFLVLLYNSPSGLVLYWTCNQIFSLVRNILDAMPSTQRDASASVQKETTALARRDVEALARRAPASARVPRARRGRRRSASLTPVFLMASGLAAALLGLLVPSAFLAASPFEFMSASGFDDLLGFVGYTTCVLGGLFMLWVGIFFFLAVRRVKSRIVCCLVCIDAVLALDYFVFGEGMGIISARLSFEEFPTYDALAIVLNIVVLAAAVAGVVWVWSHRRPLVPVALGVVLLATLGLSVPNLVTLASAQAKASAASTDALARSANPAALRKDLAFITGGFELRRRPTLGMVPDLPYLFHVEGTQEGRGEVVAADESAASAIDQELEEQRQRTDDIRRAAATPLRPVNFGDDGYPVPLMELSREGTNVVVVFLDRAVGAMVPYIMDEVPELREAYDGFTYYPNTISFGRQTLYGSSAIYGGYDYAAEAMNRRDGELNKDKHNESMRVLPTILEGYGFDSTYFDPPYVDYGTSHDPAALASDAYDLSVYYTEGALTDFYLEHGSYAHPGEVDALLSQQVSKETRTSVFCRGLVYYSFMRSAPLFLRAAIYDDGSYLSPDKTSVSAVVESGGEGSEDTTLELMSRVNVDWLRGRIKALLVGDGVPEVLSRVSVDELKGRITKVMGIAYEPKTEPADSAAPTTEGERDQNEPNADSEQAEGELGIESEGDGEELEAGTDETVEGQSAVEENQGEAADQGQSMDELVAAGSTRPGFVGAHSVSFDFLQWYSVLADLPYLTNVQEGKDNHFYVLHNLVPHQPELLQKPEYEPSVFIDNSAFAEPVYRVHNGRVMRVESDFEIQGFHANTVALLRLGEWFDYLREQGVYDNTRIIIVSDHGFWYGQFADMYVDDGEGGYVYDTEGNSALLMVKDFGEHGFRESDEFMTNADTPTLVLDGIADAATNPFTGNALDGHEKREARQLITTSNSWNPEWNMGTVFNTGYDGGVWYSVTGNPNDASNWRFEGEEIDWQEWDERKGLEDAETEGISSDGQSAVDE